MTTTANAEAKTEREIPTRVATVTRIHDVAPGIRQLTFGGLHRLERRGLDDFFLVIRPRPGRERMLDAGADFAAYRDLPEHERPDWAYYTARRWRPEDGEVDAWFVLHDHDGPISGWARGANVGDRVALWGPRTSFDPPSGTTSLLLVGDDTGLGAFASILDGADPHLTITVVAESADGEPSVPLPGRAGTTVHWVRRSGAPGTGTGLLDAVADLHVVTDGLYAYGAGESHVVTGLRKHLRHDRDIDASQVHMVGYWRRDP